MHRLITYFTLLLFIPIATLSQEKTNNCPSSRGEARVWYFGGFAGLNFNISPTEVITSKSTLQSLEGNACICDSLGNLIFALGGNTKIEVYNNQLQPQPQITGIGGNVSSTQPSIIIPRPGQDGLYDIFLLNLPIDHPNFENGLVHSVIDAFNPSEPILAAEPDTLLPKVAEGISAVHHQNQEDIWVLVHEWESNTFIAYLIGPEGLLNRDNPVRSQVGSYRGGETNYAIGTLKFSPDGTKAAYTFYTNQKVELYDFDNSTGELSFMSSTSSDYEAIYSCEFSTNSSKLYISTTHLDTPENFVSRIYQFDLNQGANWFEFPTEIASNNSKGFFCGMQLAADGKIYVARSPRYDEYIGIIHNPDRNKEECNFNTINNNVSNGLRLGEKKSRFGLPNFIQSWFNLPSFLYAANCFSDGTKFSILNTTNIDSVKWDFDDGTLSNHFKPTHRYSSPGSYKVQLYKFFNGMEFASTSEVIINKLPEVEINGGPDTVLVFTGTTARLEIENSFTFQEWSNGSTEYFIEVSEPGHYWVQASDQNCCLQSDTVFVKEIRLFIPNAFLPESGGQDATFGVVDMDNAILEMNMLIYDRWGKMVKELKDKYDYWDGSGYQSGVYFYTIKSSMVDGTNFSKNGNVTLLR